MNGIPPVKRRCPVCLQRVCVRQLIDRVDTYSVTRHKNAMTDEWCRSRVRTYSRAEIDEADKVDRA